MAKNKTTTAADDAMDTTSTQAAEAAAETTEGTQATEGGTTGADATTLGQDASALADAAVAAGEVLPAQAAAIAALEAQVLLLKAELAAAQAPALVGATASDWVAPNAAMLPERYHVVSNLEHNGESYSLGGTVYLTEKQAAPLLGHTVVRA